MSDIKLYNADCFDFVKQLPDNSIDMIFTDPPYDIDNHDGGKLYHNKKFDVSLDNMENDIPNITKSYDIEEFSKEVVRLQKNINAYFWCNKKQLMLYFNVYVNGLKCKFDIITWHKNNAIPTYSNKYLSDTEYLLHFFKGGNSVHPEKYEDAFTYFIAPINSVDKKKWEHPTIKPLEITERIIRNSSRIGETVLDPFMGSGTCGVACKNLNRNFIGIEIEKKYYEIASKRISSEGEVTECNEEDKKNNKLF